MALYSPTLINQVWVSRNSYRSPITKYLGRSVIGFIRKWFVLDFWVSWRRCVMQKRRRPCWPKRSAALTGLALRGRQSQNSDKNVRKLVLIDASYWHHQVVQYTLNFGYINLSTSFIDGPCRLVSANNREAFKRIFSNSASWLATTNIRSQLE